MITSSWARALVGAWQAHGGKLLLGVACLASACSFYDTKKVAASAGPVAAIDPNKLGFAQITADVFMPNCYECHSAAKDIDGIDVQDYSSVSKILQVIKGQAVDSMQMPLGGTMSPALRAELGAWISVGGPQNPLSP